MLIFLTSPIFTYAQNWQWAKQIGGLNNDVVGTKTSGGYMYISGSFIFNCHVDTSLLIADGYNDWFIAKYDLNGTNRLWLKQIGNNNPSLTHEGGGIQIITSTAIYCVGQFYNTLTIDGISVTSNGGSDAFVAKFDLNGTCLWIKNAGGLLDDNPGSMTTDGSGTFYWTVNINSNNGSIDGNNLNFGIDMIKLDDNGSIISIRNNLIIGGVATSFKYHNSNIYLTGVTENDSTIIDTDTLISNNVGDALLVKCDLSGNVIWARRFGNASPDDFSTDLEFDSSDNIYSVGRFAEDMTIDGNTVNCNGSNNRDMFIAKFNNNGVNLWIRNSYSSGFCNAYTNQIAKDIDDNMYIIGKFVGTAQFGSFNINTTNSSDMFLARYDENGNCLGVRHFGNALGYGVETDNNGDIWVSGVFDNTVNIGANTYTSYGMQDAFIAKSDAITGVEENVGLINNELIIYTNPNKGTFNIKLPGEIQSVKNAQLFVYDTLGKEIANFSLEKGHSNFVLPNPSTGNYTVKLIQNTKTYLGKMIVE